MIRLAANISTLFGELPFLERPAAARSCGFAAIEAQFLDDIDVEALADVVNRLELDVVLLNAPAGTAEGEWGFAGLPDARQRFRDSIETALEWAHRLACPRIHVLSGRRDVDLSAAAQRDCLIESLSWAATRALTQQVELMIEPLNVRMVSDYLVPTLADAAALIDAVGLPNLKIEFDLYHLQIMGGNILARFGNALSRIGHVQVAAVPSRAEPDAGELDIHFVLQEMDGMGYRGWIGCEYFPRGGTQEGLTWASRYGIHASDHPNR